MAQSSVASRLEKASREVEEDYLAALGILKKLKDKLNQQELHAQQNLERTPKNLQSLESTIDEINDFTELQILKSKKMWEVYRKLEQECKQSAMYSPQLDELRAACTKMEELAADLLCYSLGRFKTGQRQH